MANWIDRLRAWKLERGAGRDERQASRQRNRAEKVASRGNADSNRYERLTGWAEGNEASEQARLDEAEDLRRAIAEEGELDTTLPGDLDPDNADPAAQPPPNPNETGGDPFAPPVVDTEEDSPPVDSPPVDSPPVDSPPVDSPAPSLIEYNGEEYTQEEFIALLDEALAENADLESVIEGGFEDVISKIEDFSGAIDGEVGEVSPIPNDAVTQAYEDGEVMDMDFIQEMQIPIESMPGYYVKVPGGGNLFYKYFDEDFGTPGLAGKPMGLVKVNEDGTQTVVRDFVTLGQNYANAASATDQLRDMNFTDWLSSQGLNYKDSEISDVWDEDLIPIMDIREALLAPNASEDNRAIYDNYQGEAEEYAAGLMGMDTDEFSATMADLIENQMAGPGSMQGFSDAERNLRERQNRGNLREAEQRYGRMIENIMAGTGSSTRAMMQADMYARQINDFQLQQDVQMAQEEYERQLDQFDAQRSILDNMLQTNRIGQEQYWNRLESNMSQVWNGYMDKIGIMLQQNQEYLQRYEQDWQSLVASIDASYKAINAELGLEEAVHTQMQNYFEMGLAPIRAKLETITSTLTIEALEQSIEQGNWSLFFEGLGAVAELVGGAAELVGEFKRG